MDNNKIVGRNLKSMREANCYTQEQLASYLGVTRSAYSNYELGEREAPLALLEKACNLCGCELNLLFVENDNLVDDMLVCAFRADGLKKEDLDEVAQFKKIVLNYMKMKNLLLQ